MIGDHHHLGEDPRGSERRTEKRFTRLEAIRVVQIKPPRNYDCVLRDISEHGCRLVGVGIEGIRGPFQMTTGGTHTRLCDVAWRGRKTIGVRFLPPETSGDDA